MTAWVARTYLAIAGQRTIVVAQRYSRAALVLARLSVAALGICAGLHPIAAATAAPQTLPAPLRAHAIARAAAPSRDDGVDVAGPRRELTAAAAAPAQSETLIHIKNFAFDPVTLTVPPGQRVTWVNDDPVPHTSTNAQRVWDTGQLQPGTSVSVTFTKAGTYVYTCTVHPFMQATIVVR